MVAEPPAMPVTSTLDDDISLRDVAVRAHEARVNRLRSSMDAIAETIRWEEEQIRPVRRQLRDLLELKAAAAELTDVLRERGEVAP